MTISRRTIAAATTGVLLLAAMGCASTYEPPVDEPTPITPEVNVFYGDLAPYGRWIDYGPYGWCWTPYDATADWRPYADGYWAYTDYGWSWISYEPWGWATYHYGRWTFDPYYGWLWVPDTIWAPSWVAWHYGNGWAGWAPLPPDSYWDSVHGLHFHDDIEWRHWCFVEQRHLSQTKLKSNIVSVARNETLFKQTRDQTHYVVRGGKPVNQGPDVVAVEKNLDRKVPRLEVVDAKAPVKDQGDQVASGKVQLYRPAIKENALRTPPPSDISKPVVTISESELRAQEERDRREMEDALAKEKQELDREHEIEIQKSREAKASGDELKKRQAAEREAFERHAAEQRKVLEERQEKKIVKQKAPPPKPAPKPAPKAAPTETKPPDATKAPSAAPTKSKTT